MSAPGRDLEGGADDVLAAAIAIGLPWKRAAKAAGVSVSTVTRRMALPAFRARVAEFRKEYVTRTVGELLTVMPTAAKALGRIVKDNDKDRVAAIRTALEFGLRYLESMDQAEQIQQLREEMDALRAELAEVESGRPAPDAQAHPQAPVPRLR